MSVLARFSLFVLISISEPLPAATPLPIPRCYVGHSNADDGGGSDDDNDDDDDDDDDKSENIWTSHNPITSTHYALCPYNCSHVEFIY